MSRGRGGSCIVCGVPVQTIDDVSSAVGEAAAAPGIVMIATGTQRAALLIAPPVELGRRILVGEASLEVADERMSRDHAVVSWGGRDVAESANLYSLQLPRFHSTEEQ